MRVKMVGATDVGRRRKANQDSIYFDELQGLGVVADGIGGRKGGEIASSMAVGGLREAFLSTDRIRHEEVVPFLSSSIDNINQEIIEKGIRDGDIRGMGTTLNCLVFVGEKIHIAHVGDSRTYLFSKDHLWQMTLDHNVKNYVERGWIPKSQVLPGSKDTALLRAMGLAENCEVDIYVKKIQPGEIYLTSSDGLFDMVEDRKIAQILRTYKNQIDKLPRILIAEANRRGGKDNITVLVCKVES